MSEITPQVFSWEMPYFVFVKTVDSSETSYRTFGVTMFSDTFFVQGLPFRLRLLQSEKLQLLLEMDPRYISPILLPPLTCDYVVKTPEKKKEQGHVVLRCVLSPRQQLKQMTCNILCATNVSTYLHEHVPNQEEEVHWNFKITHKDGKEVQTRPAKLIVDVHMKLGESSRVYEKIASLNYSYTAPQILDLANELKFMQNTRPKEWEKWFRDKFRQDFGLTDDAIPLMKEVETAMSLFSNCLAPPLDDEKIVVDVCTVDKASKKKKKKHKKSKKHKPTSALSLAPALAPPAPPLFPSLMQMQTFSNPVTDAKTIPETLAHSPPMVQKPRRFSMPYLERIKEQPRLSFDVFQALLDSEQGKQLQKEEDLKQRLQKQRQYVEDGQIQLNDKQAECNKLYLQILDLKDQVRDYPLVMQQLDDKKAECARLYGELADSRKDMIRYIKTYERLIYDKGEECDKLTRQVVLLKDQKDAWNRELKKAEGKNLQELETDELDRLLITVTQTAQSITLEKQARLKKELENAAEKEIRLKKELEDWKQSALCFICCERPKNCALSCGHSFCMECCEKVAACPNCRKVIDKRTKLY